MQRKINLTLWPLGVSFVAAAGTGTAVIGSEIISATSSLAPVINEQAFTVSEIMAKIAGPAAMGLGILVFAISLFAYRKYALQARQTGAPAEGALLTGPVLIPVADEHPLWETADVVPGKAYAARIFMIASSTVVAAGIALTIVANIEPLTADVAHNLTVATYALASIALALTIIDLVLNRESCASYCSISIL